MNYTAEQLIAINQSTVHAIKSLTIHTFAGFEKLVTLKLNSTKSLLASTLTHVQSALGAKDVYELLAMRANLLEACLDTTAAYGQHSHALTTGTGLELSKVCSTQLKMANTAFVDLMQDLAQNAPAGAESAMNAFSTAVKTSQTLIESAQNAARNSA